MAYFEFPHTRNYDTDLGWLIHAFKDISAKLDQYLENAVITFADPITWDITEQYTALTCVIDSDGVAYLSKQPVPAGIDISNTDYWLPIFNYDDNINELRSQIAYNAGLSATTGVNLPEGSLVFWNGVIYRAMTDMPAGTAFIIGTNVEAYTVDRKIDDIQTTVESIRSSITYNAGADPVVTQDVYTDDLVYYNGDLYQAVTDIPAGASLVPGSNIQLRTVNEVLEQIRASIVPPVVDSVSYANILDYGAAGDGVTDDTQALLDAIAAKGAVFFPSGVYVIKQANISGDVILHGNNATLKAADAGSGQPDRMLTFTNARVLINDLGFEGLGIPSGTIPDTPDLLYAENADLYFTKCRFRNVRTLDYNNPAVNWWERFAVVLRAIDCNNIHFDQCDFYNVAGNEILYIMPHDKLLTDSMITFTNNHFESSNGMSLGFWAGVVIVKDNVFKDWRYIGSAFNLGGNAVFVENNHFYDCSFNNVFDTCEGGYWRCGSVYIKNNQIDDPETIFCINDSEDLYIEDNDVTCGTFLFDVNVTKTLAQEAGVPVAIQNTTRFVGGIHALLNNNVKIDFGTVTPTYIIRFWGIGVFAGVSDPENSTALRKAVMKGNSIKYEDAISDSQVIPIIWNSYIETCVIEDNFIENVAVSSDISSAPHVISCVQKYTRAANSLQVKGNVFRKAGVPSINLLYKSYDGSSGSPAPVIDVLTLSRNVAIGVPLNFYSQSSTAVLATSYDLDNVRQPIELITGMTFWDYLSDMHDGETRIFAFYGMTFKTISGGICIAVKNYALSTNSYKAIAFNGSDVVTGTITSGGIT